jgi:hypothetical protein
LERAKITQTKIYEKEFMRSIKESLILGKRKGVEGRRKVGGEGGTRSFFLSSREGCLFAAPKSCSGR